MNWESSIQHTYVDQKGNDKVARHSYLHENKELFAEIEQRLYAEFETEAGFEVLSIKKSKIREFVNKRTNEDEKIYIAEIVSKFVSDDGDEKETKYSVALFATDIYKAQAIVKEYMRQGLEDMEFVSLKCSKFEDIL